MKNTIIALVMGFVFGIGLLISGMVNPVKVLDFLDVAGHWDPSLAMVMTGALVVSGISFRFVNMLKKPLCNAEFQIPTGQKIDAKLIAGSALFGIGWGLAGICPGPSVVGLAWGIKQMPVFFVSMLIGMVIHERIFRGQKSSQ